MEPDEVMFGLIVESSPDGFWLIASVGSAGNPPDEVARIRKIFLLNNEELFDEWHKWLKEQLPAFLEAATGGVAKEPREIIIPPGFGRPS